VIPRNGAIDGMAHVIEIRRGGLGRSGRRVESGDLSSGRHGKAVKVPLDGITNGTVG
jgi:hypothetical protein